MGEPPGNRPAVPRDWFRGVPERYVAGADTRGRQEGRPHYSRSLRSAQSRKRVPSFVVAAGDSWNIRVKDDVRHALWKVFKAGREITLRRTFSVSCEEFAG
jgi:hypothetical protein